jgi:hypothetical protein
MLEGGQDTLEGIAHWWILEQKIRNEAAKVKEALDHLVTESLVMVLQKEGFEDILSNQL